MAKYIFVTGGVVSSLGKEEFLKALRDVISSKAKTVGDDSNGAFWADYSSSLVTRHLFCDVTLPEGESEGGNTIYNVKIEAGKKPGYILDILFAFLALAAVWSFFKIMVPDPQTFPYVVLLASCCALGFLLSLFGKAFGVKESKELGDEIRSALDGK